MIESYHKQYILQAGPGQKRCGGNYRVRFGRRAGRAVWLAGLTMLAGILVACDPVQIVEGSDTHVSIRYDGVANGLDAATQLAQKACAEHGRTARLRRTYYEGLGVGERFAFFDCV
ncbi:MAG: hypothetical protein JO007_16175 [Alphaproteobacteria bacterium]|nr:hypothetical protein [Alphaproteobacteria bacterium]